MMMRMRKFWMLWVAILWMGYMWAQVPDGYYNAAVGKSGEELRTALFNIIKTHTQLDYGELWGAYYQTDKMPSGKVWDIYSDQPGGTAAYYYTFGTNQCGNYTQEGNCYNREHTVPQSWFGDAVPMKTDLFHLYPTDGWVNNKRSNHAYGEVNAPTWTSTNGSKLGPCSYPGCSGTVFEPIDAYKGDLARSYFYMTVCYMNKDLGQDEESMFSGSQLVGWAKNMLVEWHNADPVSEKEINRNQVIFNSYQHNRNPFIDCPELVEYLFGARQNEPWYPTCVDWSGVEIDQYHLAQYQECQVYPNPAGESCWVESNYLTISKVEVLDFSGKVMMMVNGEGSRMCWLDVSGLSAGCYFVRVTTDRTVETLKLLVQQSHR